MQPHGGVATISPFVGVISQRRDPPAPTWEPVSSILPALARFAPISLAEMDRVALMSRIDTKYVLPLSRLSVLLAGLEDGYRVLEVEGVRLNRYRTLYFDTENLDLYALHHAGRSERYKVRSRCYLDSGASFLEVKRRTNKGRTVKERIGTEAFLTRLTPEASRFVQSLAPSGGRPLLPTLWNEFSRITLVSERRPERVTIDVNLRFKGGGGSVALAGVVIAEVKQEERGSKSGMSAAMRAMAVHAMAFSKYCIGAAMLYPEVKHNRFKPVLRAVDQIMRGGQGG